MVPVSAELECHLTYLASQEANLLSMTVVEVLPTTYSEYSFLRSNKSEKRVGFLHHEGASRSGFDPVIPWFDTDKPCFLLVVQA
jgi:hypothetical protein